MKNVLVVTQEETLVQMWNSCAQQQGIDLKFLGVYNAADVQSAISLVVATGPVTYDGIIWVNGYLGAVPSWDLIAMVLQAGYQGPMWAGSTVSGFRANQLAAGCQYETNRMDLGTLFADLTAVLKP